MEPKLRLPFNGDYAVTFSFGAVSENEEIKKKFSEWGITGHHGIDYGLSEGTEVVAAETGKVIQSGENGEWGISVTLEHSWGQSIYAHLKETKVSLGDEPKAGDVIGLSGKTGAAFGEHLHFGIKLKDADANNGYLGFTDPTQYFSKPEEKPQEQPKAEETKPPESPQQQEAKEPEVKEVIKEVIKEVPVVNQEEVNKQVEEVDDDTVVLSNGSVVRYVGITAPENNEHFEKESTEENKRLVEGKSVTLEYDNYKADKFGRILAYLIIDSKNVSVELARKGMAQVVIYQKKKAFIYQDQLLKAQTEARKNHRGIWNK